MARHAPHRRRPGSGARATLHGHARRLTLQPALAGVLRASRSGGQTPPGRDGGLYAQADHTAERNPQASAEVGGTARSVLIFNIVAPRSRKCSRGGDPTPKLSALDAAGI